jgi:hypothetical protein
MALKHDFWSMRGHYKERKGKGSGTGEVRKEKRVG